MTIRREATMGVLWLKGSSNDAGLYPAVAFSIPKFGVNWENPVWLFDILVVAPWTNTKHVVN